MHDYIIKELPEFIGSIFTVDPKKKCVSGHSMGGHGAMSLTLRNPGHFQSASAFAPIYNPTKCPWGKTCFEGYLGSVDAGKEYDTIEILKSYNGPRVPIRVEQGTDDKFLQTLGGTQLDPQSLITVCGETNYPLQFNWRTGYDHSYYMISTFISEHVEFHANNLGLCRKQQ